MKTSFPVGAFVFDAYAFDTETARLTMTYAFQGGPVFQEVIQFPPIARPLSSDDRLALDRACRLIFLLAGVSYYKAFVPSRLVVKPFVLDADTKAFVTEVYREGLGEFAYRNQIDVWERINFENGEGVDIGGDVEISAAPALDLIPHALVPVGGGKDSIVSLETLRRVGQPMTLFALASTSVPAAPIQATIEVAQLPAITVARHLSPNLGDLNKAGAFNGHVPITAILSAIAVAAAVMQKMGYVVVSNERSASAPNLFWHGHAINHQYSKSWAFEQAMAAYVTKVIAADLHYLSLLRPLGEAAITARFSRYIPYHPVFHSCNAAFRQDPARRLRQWCCHCPKCRFVFLALAPFMPPDRLIEIFGSDMLSDRTQSHEFAALCGLGADKPFECVGEAEESRLLFYALAEHPLWKERAVVRDLQAQLPANPDWSEAYHAMLMISGDHQVPERWLRGFDEML